MAWADPSSRIEETPFGGFPAYTKALAQPTVQGEGNPKPEHVHAPPKPSSRKHGS